MFARSSSMVLSIVFALSAPAALSAEVDVELQDRAIISSTLPEIQTALESIQLLLRKIDEAGEDGWIFSSGKEKWESELNTVLEGLLSSLTADTYTEAAKLLKAFDTTLGDLTTEVDKLSLDLRFAPEGDGALSLMDRAMLRSTAEGSENALKAEIQELSEQISKIARERRNVISDYAAAFQKATGQRIELVNAESLLYQVNGSTIDQALTVWNAISLLEGRLGEDVVALPSATSRQRYYSVAAVSRLMLVRMYQLHLDKYDHQWLPSLAARQSENDALMAETQTAKSNALNDAQRNQLELNLETQRLLDEAIEVSREVLLKRRAVTEAALETLSVDAVVAVNTLKTLERVLSFSFEALSSKGEFDALSALNPLELLPLDKGVLNESLIALNNSLGDS